MIDMERKIGEIFEYNGEWYQCVKGACNDCIFNHDKLCNSMICLGDDRADNTPVIFKKLEKVGEPITIAGKLYQKVVTCNTLCDYCILYDKVSRECNLPKTQNTCFGNEAYVEIKQTKEDMEEKNNGNTPLNVLTDKYVNGDICYDDFEKEVKALYSCKEEIKPILKEFDLEAAKAGKPVCTRDGRKARIICFDRITSDDYYKIVACITSYDGKDEYALTYGIDGYIINSQYPQVDDLMMLPEKKEGWVNVYRTSPDTYIRGCIYNTEEEASKHIIADIFVATGKVSWEE